MAEAQQRQQQQQQQQQQYQTIYNQICGVEGWQYGCGLDNDQNDNLYQEIINSWLPKDKRDIGKSVSNANILMENLGALKIGTPLAEEDNFDLLVAYIIAKEKFHEEDTVHDDGRPKIPLLNLFITVKRAQGGKRNKRRTQKRNGNKRINNSRKQKRNVSKKNNKSRKQNKR